MGIESLLSQQIIGLSESIDDRLAALLVAGTGITLTYNDGAGTLTIAVSSSFDGSFAALTGKPTTLLGYGITDAQPLDSDLTSIAALTTTSFGRSLLTQADAAATRTTIGAGTGTISGSTGATDNCVLRADGTGGATVQNSAVTIDDSGNISTSGGITAVQPITVGTNGFSCPIGGNGYRFVSGGYFICTSNGVFRFSNSTDSGFDRLQLGGTTSSFPSIKRNGTAINFRLANDSADCSVTAATATLSALLFVGSYTVATLPAAASNTGAIAQATDSSVTANGSTVAGGGANRVLVFSNGSTWDVVVA